MGWLIFLCVLILLGFLPLGIQADYQQTGASVLARIGPLRIPLYPQQKKEKTSKKEKKKTENTGQADPPKPTSTGGDFRDFLPLARLAWEFLTEFFTKRLCVQELNVHIRLAGGSPDHLAIQYGKTWAAIGNLWPRLEELLIIRKRNVDVSCDFTGGKTCILAHAVVSVTLGRLLWLALRYGLRALREYRTIQKKRKGGAVI